MRMEECGLKKAILISCFDWYEIRLVPIVSVLKQEYDVEVVMSDFNHINKTYNTCYKEVNYIHAKKYKKNISMSRVLSHIDFARNVGKYLDKMKPDMIYALLPPNSVAGVCSDYKKKNPECKLFYDLIDMWPESFPIDGLKSFPLIKYWKKLRDVNLLIADHVFTECKLFKNNLPKINEKKISTLYLFKDISDSFNEYIKSEIENHEYFEHTQLVLGYVGSINNIIDIEAISKVINKTCEKYDVLVNVIGDGESRDRFISALKNAGAEVIYHGKIFDDNVKFQILSKCDYGINMMKDNVMVGLTIKSIDYLSYGIPLISNIKGDTADLIRDNNIGININDEDAFKRIKKIDKDTRLRVFSTYLSMFSRQAYESEIRTVIESQGW